jgi:cytochrome c peroxidase
VAITSNGIAVVSLGGVDEIAIGREEDYSLYRIPVGKRPTALTITQDGQFAFSANTFGDSVSFVNLTSRKAEAEISLGPQPLLSSIENGELLFFDAKLSHDGWMSCHSCHTDGHSNGLLNDNLSDASFGAPKRVLSLLGVHDTAPFAWNGGIAELTTQIHNSITKTMQSDHTPTQEQLDALSAYIQSLEPPPAVDTLRGTQDVAATVRGAAVFERLGCMRCHAPGIYTTPQAYDVGLVDAGGHRTFNPPSLRGLSQRGPYFHDNSSVTLEDVFFTHSHQLPEVTPAEADVRDLLAFLRSL